MNYDVSIGYGACWNIKKARMKANSEFRAIKVIDKFKISANAQNQLKQEIANMRNLIHPNIVRLYELYESKTCIFLVLEHCEG